MAVFPRRRFLASTLLGLGVFATSHPLAQTRIARIGYLVGRQKSTPLPGIVKRLGELSYVEGKNLIIDCRSADGVAERYLSLARDLIRAKPDLIFAVGSEHAARALLKAKASVPVIILADSFSDDQLAVVRKAAEQLRTEFIVERFNTPPYDLASAFARGTALGAGAVLPLTSAVFSDLGPMIAMLAIKHRLPSVGPTASQVKAGLLASYGVNSATAFNRAADIALKILKGTPPGDIPVEQPTHFEVAINMKTARTLGLTLPPTVLVRAVQ
jgi:putative ABC transport system substrate-binding protein